MHRLQVMNGWNFLPDHNNVKHAYKSRFWMNKKQDKNWNVSKIEKIQQY